LFHGGAAARSLVAVNEALRVLRPGDAFVFVDRFGDANDYGDPAELARVLLATRNFVASRWSGRSAFPGPSIRSAHSDQCFRGKRRTGQHERRARPFHQILLWVEFCR
jgi:hypothetical protein